MRLSAIAALLGVALATGYGESSRAGVIGPGDFGPGAVVQTFDALTENYFGTYGPLVLDGVTYSTSLPDMYRIPRGSDCFSGSCFGIHVQGAWFTITLDNPAERIGGYLLGPTFDPYVTLYDVNHDALTGFNASYFFGFQSDSNNIKYIDVIPRSGVFGAALDNFTYEIASPVAAVPEPSTWAMLLIGFASVGFLAHRQGTKSQGKRTQRSADHHRA